MAKVNQIEDKNGVVKDIVDKGLDEKTSQNSIASSDYVLLEDTDGAYHKIAKASFTEAVRSALGAVINSVAKGNDIAKVPVLDSNNDLGMGTLANLASVLGVSGLFDSSRNCSLYVKYDVKGGEGLVVFGLRINDLEGQIGIGVVDKNLYVRGVYKGNISDVSWDKTAKQ